MFDKIPSLKDFLIYFIPGALTCFFCFDILNHWLKNEKLIDTVSKSNLLVFIGVLLSFTVGFLLSQVQIILFGRLMPKKGMGTIANTDLPDDFKKLLINKIIDKFDLTASQNDLINDKRLLDICREFVVLKTNEASVMAIDRSKNLSVLPLTLNFPVILGVMDLLIVLGLNIISVLVFTVITTLLCIYTTQLISTNFKKGWVCSIYTQFMLID